MNIIYTGDSLRQNTNVFWLKEFTSQAIRMALGNNTSFSTLFDEGEYSEHWVEHFNIHYPSWHLFRLRDYNKQDTVIVSFELPPNSYSQLIEEGFKVIDFNFHPLRFLNDLAFGVKTNICDIQKCFQIRYEDIRNVVSQYKAMYLTKHDPVALHKDKKRVALLIGQTSIDASLIHEGKIVSLNDFKEEILAIKNSYDELWIKPHPYDMNNSVIGDLVLQEGNFLTESNIYELLANPNIELVAGISSSVLHEAAVFSKRVQTFIPMTYDATPIYGLAPNTVSFWKSILCNDKYFDAYYSFEDQIRMISSKSELRRARDTWWGYSK